MARRKADAEIDLQAAYELSAGLIEALKCPPEKEQVFLKDSKTRGLFVRATRRGRKAFVFESRINSRTYRVTLGEPGRNDGPTRETKLNFAPTQEGMDTALYFGRVDAGPDVFYVARTSLLQLLAPVFKTTE
jgi:hypothetical protein